MAATFSVPARRRRSCPPPRIERLEVDAVADDERADALGPAELVRGQRHASTPSAREIDRDAARGLHGVGMHQQSVLARERRQSPRPAA